MIVRTRSHWLRMLFVWHGSVIAGILPQLGISTAIAVLVTVFHGQILGYKVSLTAVPFTLLGITLAIFLGFRNTVSYERYWEARKLWGGLLNDTRSAARQVISFASVADSERSAFVHGLIGFVHAVRHQLRNTPLEARFVNAFPSPWRERIEGARFRPAMMLTCLGQTAGAWFNKGALDPMLTSELDRSLSRLTDALGGCERISSTPIPFAYSVLLHRTVYLYSFLLPFGLVDSIGSMTAVMVAFVSYTFFALDALASEIEDPFGLEPNDLALDAMSQAIEITLREMLGEQDLPPAMTPIQYRLM